MSTPDKCPHCGAIRIEGREYACGYIFRQNVRHNPRTHECLLNSERSAHAATRKELDECKASNKKWQSLASGQIKTTKAELSELEALRARVRELEGLKVCSAYYDHGTQLTIRLNHIASPVCETLGEAMPRKEEK